MPTDRFVFEGFLPAKHVARLKRLQALAKEDRTMIFYEAPHKIIVATEDMLEVLGDRRAVFTRELTKIHEEAIRGTLSEIGKHLQTRSIKGEFTIIVHGASSEPLMQDIDTAEYLKNLIIHRGLSKKEAVATAAKELRLPKEGSI